MNVNNSTKVNNSPSGRRLFFGTRLTHSQKMVLGIIVVASIVAVPTLAAYSYLSKTQASSASQASPSLLPAETIRLKREDHYSVAQAFVGRLEAKRASQLGFERGGLLMEVFKDEGDPVEADEPIAKLDTQNLFSRRSELIAQRKRAEAMLKEMEAGPRKEVIAAARAEVQQTQARYQQAKLRATRQQQLYQRNSASEQERDDAIYEAEATLAQQKAAESRLEELINGTRQEQIDAQAAQVEHLKAQIATLDIELDKSTLRAPYAGTVGQRHLDEGAVVLAGQTIVELLETNVLQARIGLSGQMSDELGVGQSHPLYVRGKQLLGVVGSIRPDRDPQTRTVTVLLDVEASGKRLFVDDLVTLRLKRRITKPGYWLPTSALVESVRGLWACYVASPESETEGIFTLQRREVEVLHQETERAFVRGTLQPGELVVAAGNHRFVPGQRVRLSGPPAEETQQPDKIARLEELP